ncbi:MAG: pilus assembly protein PilM [Heliobacteriaceae bacterium]|nr:pilus assembly protein PilM [Heliobacteriaceae bacterium]
MNWGKVYLGIDLGRTQVRMVEITCRWRSYQVSGIVTRPLPASAGADGNETPDPAILLDTLRECQATLKGKARQAILAFSSRNLIMRQIRLPVMPEAEIRAAMRWEVERYIPFPVEDLVFDLVNQGTVAVEGQTQSQLLLVAAPRREVVEYYEVLRQVGLQVIAVETAPFALARLYGQYGGLAGDTFGILDLSLQATITVVKAGTVQFVRTIPGNLEQVADEVRRSLDFYRIQSRDQAFSSLILVGDSAQLAGLPAGLTQELAVPVTLGDLPTALAGVVPADWRPLAGSNTATALGLALRPVCV